jgi:hypothetical protein
VFKVYNLQVLPIHSPSRRLSVRLRLAAFVTHHIERKALNLVVVGSSPTVGAKCWYSLFWASGSNRRVEKVLARFNREW